jgi:hypothetical protein
VIRLIREIYKDGYHKHKIFGGGVNKTIDGCPEMGNPIFI